MTGPAALTAARAIGPKVSLAGLLLVLLHGAAAGDGDPSEGLPTLVETVGRADAACLVEQLQPSTVNQLNVRVWQQQGLPTVRFNVVRVAKAAGGLVRPLDDIQAGLPQEQSIDRLYLLVGRRAGESKIVWSFPIAITEDQFDYATQAPPPNGPIRKRMAYSMSFLDAPDPRISTDALTEFSGFSLRELVDARDLFSKDFLDKNRAWLADSHFSRLRISVAARVLAVFGGERETALRLAYFARFLDSPDRRVAADALAEISRYRYREFLEMRNLFSARKREDWRREFADPKTPQVRRTEIASVAAIWATEQDLPQFEKNLFQSPADSRYGLREIASGYLMLAGEKGLGKIDEWIKNDRTVSAHDARAALEAIETLGDELPQKASRDRLLRSVRLFLERPDQVRPAIALLARWEDWSVRDRLLTLFGAGKPDPFLPRWEIVQYYLTASRSPHPGADGNDPREWAGRYLERLRMKDRSIVARVEKVFNETTK